MTLLQTIVITGTVIWGLVAIQVHQTDEQEKQRTEQNARANARGNR